MSIDKSGIHLTLHAAIFADRSSARTHSSRSNTFLLLLELLRFLLLLFALHIVLFPLMIKAVITLREYRHGKL